MGLSGAGPAMAVPLVAVAALGRNGVIGKDGALPWRLPTDLARFRDLTMGTPMIMGRRTWESIGRPLPGRDSIVVSRDESLALPDGVWRAASPIAALRIARGRATALEAGSVSLIGGAELFAALLALTDRLALTFVDLAPAGEAAFPYVDPGVWREVSRETPARRPDDEASCTFVDFVRLDRASGGA